MSIIFYNIISFLLGAFILFYGIFSFSKFKNILSLCLSIIHSILLIACGIVGFIINENYSYIIIIIMAVLAISYILILMLYDRKVQAKKNEEEK